MPQPPSQPGTERHLARTTGRAATLERRFPAVRFLPVVFDGAGAELVPGIYGDVGVHFNGIILRWRLLALEAGSLQLDIWKTDYPGFPPTVADTITGSEQPTLSSSDKNESTALTGWTKDVVEGDTLRFNIDSVSGITRATLTLAIAA